jgi:hypothetical protein
VLVLGTATLDQRAASVDHPPIRGQRPKVLEQRPPTPSFLLRQLAGVARDLSKCVDIVPMRRDGFPRWLEAIKSICMVIGSLGSVGQAAS